MSQVTIKQLKEAIEDALQKGISEDSVIEISVQSYNSRYPLYIPLKTSGTWNSVISEAPYKGTVRLYSSLPSNNEKYTIFTERKIK